MFLKQVPTSVLGPAVLLLGGGCSEYWLGLEKDDVEGGPEVEKATGWAAVAVPLDVCEQEADGVGRVQVDETCITDPEGEFQVRVEWAMPNFDFTSYPEFGEILMTPVVGQMTDDNGDGVVDASDTPDIVVIADKGENANTQHGLLRIISGKGDEVWLNVDKVSADDGHADFHPYQYSNVAIGDINSDGEPEIVLVATAIVYWIPSDTAPPDPIIDTEDSGGGGSDSGEEDTENEVRDGTEGECRVIALTRSGELLWAAEEQALVCGGHSPALADIEGDGDFEVILGNLVLNAEDGSLSTQLVEGYGAFMAYPEIGYQSFASDLDGDGTMEIITGRSIHSADGSATCELSTTDDGFPAVADLNGDGKGEVAVVGSGNLRIFDSTCTVLGEFPLAGDGNGGPPTIADMDGDGEPEIGVADATYYAVYEIDGTVLWKSEVDDESSHATGSSVFDFDGDGRAEVLYGDELAMRIYDGATGTIRYQSDDHTSRTLHEYPVVADVDGDGEAEVVVTNGGGHAEDEFRGLYVLGSVDHTWRKARTVWNQHAYSITNIGEDLTIPTTTPPNWPTYNSFRSASLGDLTDGRRVDAVPVIEGVCLDDCDQGAAFMLIRLGNSGLADLPADIPVTLYAVWGEDTQPIARFWSTEILASGMSTLGYRVDLDPELLLDADLLLVADDDGYGNGTIWECNEENNTLLLEGPICPEMP